jgi:hypothetical protein
MVMRASFRSRGLAFAQVLSDHLTGIKAFTQSSVYYRTQCGIAASLARLSRLLDWLFHYDASRYQSPLAFTTNEITQKISVMLTRLTLLAGLFLALGLVTPAPAQAQDRPVVVELFTSQGCSSCPPADAYMHELAARDDVIALALHVDYWDYIGWKDSFAKSEFTARQRAYARVSGKSMVYTPQMVINGSDDVVGNRPRDVADLIARHKGASAEIALTISRSGDRLSIRAEPPARPVSATVQLVRYMPSARVAIKRGENAGRTFDYANVVTDLRILGEWDMRTPLRLEAPLRGAAPAVVLIQENRHGPIHAVARVK